MDKKGQLEDKKATQRLPVEASEMMSTAIRLLVRKNLVPWTQLDASETVQVARAVDMATAPLVAMGAAMDGSGDGDRESGVKSLASLVHALAAELEEYEKWSEESGGEDEAWRTRGQASAY